MTTSPLGQAKQFRTWTLQDATSRPPTGGKTLLNFSHWPITVVPDR